MAISDSHLPLNEATRRMGSIISGIRETRIQVDGSRTTAGSTTIYTVPAARVLHITACWITSDLPDSNSTRFLEIANAGGSVYKLIGISGTSSRVQTQNSISYPYPAKADADEIIRIITVENGATYAGFTGWLDRPLVN